MDGPFVGSSAVSNLRGCQVFEANETVVEMEYWALIMMIW